MNIADTSRPAGGAAAEGGTLLEAVAAGVLLAVSALTVFGAPAGFALLSWLAFTNPDGTDLTRDVGMYCAACSFASLVLPAGLVGLMWVEATAPAQVRAEAHSGRASLA